MWYYTLNGQQAGPISQTELAQKLNGQLPPDTLVWKEGMENWSAANTIAVFRNFQTPPPLNPTTADSNNPYAPPSSNLATEPDPTSEYPLPKVKKSSYPLLASLTILGILVLTTGYGLMFAELISSAETSSTYAETHYSIENSEGAIIETTETESSQVSSDPDFGNIGSSMLIIGIGWLINMAGFILGLIYLHRAWKLVQANGTDVTPAKAVGFLFIPFFNLYWVFIAYKKWAEEWNSIRNSSPSMFQAPAGAAGVFLAMPICYYSSIFTSILGILACGILYLIGMKSMCNAINFASEYGNQT
ncbi:DUF4339 domain-containing protein [Rubritalea spongiae]|uniref:DUF4339 domain-containing protein n=1 Tax=Rubritalea spongiae TaxID=430797 RepID=A0ABW5E2B3_9BACT